MRLNRIVRSVKKHIYFLLNSTITTTTQRTTIYWKLIQNVRTKSKMSPSRWQPIYPKYNHQFEISIFYIISTGCENWHIKHKSDITQTEEKIHLRFFTHIESSCFYCSYHVKIVLYKPLYSDLFDIFISLAFVNCFISCFCFCLCVCVFEAQWPLRCYSFTRQYCLKIYVQYVILIYAVHIKKTLQGRESIFCSIDWYWCCFSIRPHQFMI